MDPAPRILLIDNYDSFTWNLAQYFQELGAELEVRYNDELPVERALARSDDAIVISPGPGRPESAGICLDLVRALGRDRPLLGVCLGHQVLAQAYGARIVEAPTLMHGKTSPIVHDRTGLFAGLPSSFEATRYHSLVVDEATLHSDFEVTARTPEGVVMAIRHRSRPLYGVQFHPESIMTRHGKGLLANFLASLRDPARLLPAGAKDGK